MTYTISEAPDTISLELMRVSDVGLESITDLCFRDNYMYVLHTGNDQEIKGNNYINIFRIQAIIFEDITCRMIKTMDITGIVESNKVKIYQ